MVGSKVVKKEVVVGSQKGKPGVRKDGKPRRKPVQSFKPYIKRVLKQVHPGMGLTPQGLSVLISLVFDIRDRLSGEAGRLAIYGKGRTLGSREIQSAVKLLIPGELAKHAVSEGTKAVTTYRKTFPEPKASQSSKGSKGSKGSAKA